jgi:tetratricopeptide (TPR) repeat protein
MKSHELKTRRQRVRELEDAHQWASALVAVRAILELDPRDANALLLMGGILANLARYAEAETALQEAHALFDDDSDYVVHREFGNLYKAWGRYELALAAYQKVAVLRPTHASGHIYSGSILARLGRFDEAAACHQRGTQCSGGCVEEAHYNLGLIFRAQERFDDALACFDQALAIDPTYEEAQVARADVLAARQT